MTIKRYSMAAYFSLPKHSISILTVLERMGPLPLAEIENLAIIQRGPHKTIPEATISKLLALGLLQRGPIGQLDITGKGLKVIYCARDLADVKADAPV